jgi:hypothetical protein
MVVMETVAMEDGWNMLFIKMLSQYKLTVWIQTSILSRKFWDKVA